ncbi:unnamed protein product [Leuciscus chuanchicus]
MCRDWSTPRPPRAALMVPPVVKVNEEKQRLQIITHTSHGRTIVVWSSARTQHNGFLSRRSVLLFIQTEDTTLLSYAVGLEIYEAFKAFWPFDVLMDSVEQMNAVCSSSLNTRKVALYFARQTSSCIQAQCRPVQPNTSPNIDTQPVPNTCRPFAFLCLGAFWASARLAGHRLALHTGLWPPSLLAADDDDDEEECLTVMCSLSQQDESEEELVIEADLDTQPADARDKCVCVFAQRLLVRQRGKI